MGLLDDAIREHLDLKRRRGADPAEVARAEREALGPVRRAPAEAAEATPDGDELAYDQEDDLAYEDEPDWEQAPGEQAESTPAASDQAEPPDEPAADEEPTRLHEPAADEEPTRLHEPQADEEPTRLHEPPAKPPVSRPGEPNEDDNPFAAEDERDRLAAHDPDDPLAHEDGPTAPGEGQPPPRAAAPAPHPAPASAAPARQPNEHPGQDTAEYHVEGTIGEDREDVLEETPEFLQDTPEHDRLWFEQRPPRDFDFDG